MNKRRVCAQCGVTEPNTLVLVFRINRMFKIWKGASSEVDLCSFECEKIYRREQRMREVNE